MKLTGKGAQALRIIRDVAIHTPGQFAELFFAPDAVGWKRSISTGYGSIPGGAMPQTAGSYLAKLEKEGWVGEYSTEAGRSKKGVVYRTRHFFLTDAGKAALAEYEEQYPA